jgi:molybdate transport system substrate-binding protein
MNRFGFIYLFICYLLFSTSINSQPITIAAAADLRYAMDDIVKEFNKTAPAIKVNVIYGSSGNLYQQLVNQASFQAFFSADISYASKLDSLGLTSGRPKLYAIGHLVLWSSTLDVTKGIPYLISDAVKKIAIANPATAPYGKRAVECLKYYRVYNQVQDKIVKGENVSQAAQFALTGNAEVGLIALSLALSPEMMAKGKYYLLDETSYSRLEQAFVIMKMSAQDNTLKKFISYLDSEQARKIFVKYGFKLPGEN